MARESKVLTEPKYTERLDRERECAYAAQMTLYANQMFPLRNSASSRPASRFLVGPPGGRGALLVDEAWYATWNPKADLVGPPVDPTHPENLYGTLAVDRCLAEQNA